MKSKSQRVSSVDVANVANVSQSTVSRVFSPNGHKVSEKTRKKVLAVAEELGYEPNIMARSMVVKRTRLIGLVYESMDNEFYIKTVDYFTKYFQENEYFVLLFKLAKGQNLEEQIQLAMRYNVDGLVITTAMISPESISWCLKLKDTPIFLFNRVSEGIELNSVCCRNYDGAYSVVEYLVNKGKKNLLFISGDKNASTNAEKESGFNDAVNRFGIKGRMIGDSFSYECGMKAGKEYVDGDYSDVDGVFCSNDYIAMGFYDYLRHNTDIEIPSGLALVGYDGIVDNINYPITTYRQPLETMIKETVRVLVGFNERPSNKTMHLSYSGEIVEKASV